MAPASLSFNLAPFSSLPLRPSHAVIDPALRSLISPRPWRTLAIPRPQAIHASSLPSCSSSSRRRAFSTPRVFTNSSPAIEENPESGKFLPINSISVFVRFKQREDAGSSDIISLFKPREDGGSSDVIGELQSALVRYRKRFQSSLLHPSLEVDLVSTIHVADKEYFETLQRELDSYDCVLYEMVLSKRDLADISKGKFDPTQKQSIVEFLQDLLAKSLSLNFQLECLDYGSEKWQHADLDFETFFLLEHERGESTFTLVEETLRKLTDALIQPSIPSRGPWKSMLRWASRVLPMPLVLLLMIGSSFLPFKNDSTEHSELSSINTAAAVKFSLAKMLPSDFTQITTFIDPNSVILGERNKVVAKALRRAVDSGHQRIAILYGAGHMPDLDRRLREEFDMVPSGVQWITAWSIRNEQPNINSSPD